MKPKPLYLLVVGLLLLALGCTSDSAKGSLGGINGKSSSVSGKAAEGTPLKNGTSAPSFLLTDLDGNEVALSKFKDNVVMLNFWATWCIPCVAEMPALERLYKTYADKGLVVVAISVDQDKELVSAFVKDNGITFPVLLDSQMTASLAYEVMGFPETFFIDGAGHLFSVKDPQTGETGVRIISDRPWDAQAYTDLIANVVDTYRHPNS